MTIIKWVATGAIILLTAKETTAQKNAAQTSYNSGVFVTSEDFEKQKISYSIPCDDKMDKLKVEDNIFSNKSLIIKTGKEKKSLKKNNVFGYRDCHLTSFRFFDNQEFQILDTASFYLYSERKVIRQVKGEEEKGTAYFFSTKSNNAILPLTMQNLKSAFPDNSNFQYAIESDFRSNAELIKYDNFKKTYKIKYVFNQSLK